MGIVRLYPHGIQSTVPVLVRCTELIGVCNLDRPAETDKSIMGDDWQDFLIFRRCFVERLAFLEEGPAKLENPI